MVVDGKIVSQLCDEEGNMTEMEFKEAMSKQVPPKLAHVFFEKCFCNFMRKKLTKNWTLVGCWYEFTALLTFPALPFS